MMTINIYYGGRGLIEDPTIYVINKLTEVLEELRVVVNRYNLFEEKHSISTLTRTLKDCNGIILATTVEWLGIGGLMQQFLDDCWLYADKEHLSKLYMMPVVTSSTYGEKDASYLLTKSWDMLGGISCTGISAYVENHVEFETNPDYMFIIEKKAESLYRTISQKKLTLPSSSQVLKQNVLRKNTLELTPQESEQLSIYVSDDTYVKKQKEDIEELTQLFKEMLGDTEADSSQELLNHIKSKFDTNSEITASYSIFLTDIDKTIVIEANASNLKCYYGQKNDADVIAKTTLEVFQNILDGELTFQKAFMSGVLTAKGNFKTLRAFDSIFQLS